MSVVEYAREAGVNRSTIYRIVNGEVEPSISLMRELAIAHGLDIDITLRPLSDPDAAIAARILLDAAFDGHEATEPERQWLRRLDRHNDPLHIVRSAGAASAPAHRPGAILLRGPSDALRLASAGHASGGQWAVSGRAALEAGQENAPRRAPSILWATEPDRAARMLGDTHRQVTSAANAHVIVVPAPKPVFVDTWQSGAVRIVAPIQMLLDCIGLGGELEMVALSIAERWSVE